MSDFMSDLAEEAADLSAVPDDNQMTTLREAGTLLVDTDLSIKELEESLESAKRRKKELAHKIIPDIMNGIGLDTLGLSEARVDLELKPYAHASISKDWDDEKREKAFAHIEELGGGDIVRTITTLSAGKGDLESMQALYALIQVILQAPYTDDQSERITAVTEWFCENGETLQKISVNSNLELTVPWNTLTSFVKEQTELGAILDLECLGATVGQVVKIKQRKD